MIQRIKPPAPAAGTNLDLQDCFNQLFAETPHRGPKPPATQADNRDARRQTPKGTTQAASYIRMSGRQQDKSPAEQREEIAKLAAREGCHVAKEHWFIDEAITGDSGTDDRPGLAALLAAAKAGKFTVVLVWHTNRISREDPMDAIGFYNQLRKAGVNLHTCCEGAIDLDDFTKQLLLFVNQKGSNDYLSELSAKSLRGRVANAKKGGWNGGPAPYGMDRGEYDASGRLIRRLKAGERKSGKGSYLRLLPSTDQQKVEAVRYAFERFDTAHLSVGQLARELEAKGYPPPAVSLNGWTRHHVYKLLTRCLYAGISRWGATAEGSYFHAQGDNIVSCNQRKRKIRRKPVEDAITVNDAHEGIIPVDLFERVYRKAKATSMSKRFTANDYYPLSGLLFCAHCTRRMIANTAVVKNPKLGKLYTYQTYVCASYKNYGTLDPANNPTCGHHCIRADRLLTWLADELRAAYLGPSPEAFANEIAAKLKERNEAGNIERLEKRAKELDREVNRLVTAIQTSDAPQLVERLEAVREESHVLAEKLAAARTMPDTEADRLCKTCEELTSTDPAILRNALRRFVAWIECRWESDTRKRGRVFPLSEGRVYLHEPTLFGGKEVLTFSAADLGSRWQPPRRRSAPRPR